MPNIKFGTDGWRAIMGKEFTFENVALVAQAFSDYLKDDFKKKGGPRPPKILKIRKGNTLYKRNVERIRLKPKD